MSYSESRSPFDRTIDRPLSRAERRLMAKQIEKSNKAWPLHLVKIPREKWEQAERNSPHGRPRLEVWRSRDFLVQVFEEERGMQRMSVTRSIFDAKSNQWKDSISWDELQRLKQEIGRGDVYAIEIYPRDVDTVNVANMRHLWMLPAPLEIGWFAEGRGHDE